MKLCPYFDFSSDRVKIRCRRSLLESTERFFHVNICCHNHAVRKGVNERSDFLRPLSIKFCGCP